MEYRNAGKTELKLSVLGMGCWSFGGGEYWGEQNQEDVDKVVAKAVDLGINYFDTAEAYNNGASEKSLGLALGGVDRDKVIIGTKVSPSNTDPKNLIASCEASLKRLKTDYIDLYMVHWPITPAAIAHFTEEKHCPSLEKAFATLNRLKHEGKIRYIGVSNFNMRPLKEALATETEIVVNQIPYSLLTRGVEWDILPWCRSRGIGTIGYMSLMQGVLANIYKSLDNVPLWQRRTRHFDSRTSSEARHGGTGAEVETNQALEDIRKLSGKSGKTMPELAVAWTLTNPGITCSLAGSRNIEELQANVNAVQNPLDKSIIQELNTITEELKIKLGAGFDYYESPENDRTK